MVIPMHEHRNTQNTRLAWVKYYTIAVLFALVTFILTGLLVAALPQNLAYAPMIGWAISIWLVSRWARSEAMASH